MTTLDSAAQPDLATRRRDAALRDIAAGIGDVALWGRLGARDLARRYRRTLLGPLWGAMKMGIFVAALGLVGSRLMSESDPHYVPYVAAGMVVWTFMLECTGEFTALFTSRGHLIRQIRLPYTLLACIALAVAIKKGTIDAKKQQFRVGIGLRKARPAKVALRIQHRIESVEMEQPRMRGHQVLDRVGICADMVGAIDVRSGESNKRGGGNAHGRLSRRAVASARNACWNSGRTSSALGGMNWA